MSCCGSHFVGRTLKKASAIRPVAVVLLVSLPLAFAAGCGSSDKLNRQAISGKVTVDGAAVPNGSVSFEPTAAGGISSGAVITNGAYSIAKESGLPPGKYRVRITGDDGKGFKVAPGKMPGDEEMPEKKELIPADWNTESNHEVEVSEKGSMVFDFLITTASSEKK